MFKKLMLPFSVICCALAISSCASFFESMAPPQKAPPIQIKDKLTAFALATYLIDSRNYDIEKFDYAKGAIITVPLEYKVSLSHLRARLVLALTQESTLYVEFVHVQRLETEYSSDYKHKTVHWRDAGHAAAEFIPVRNKIIATLDSLQSNPATLEKCMDHFLGNFRYSYIVLKTLTEVGRTRFVEEHYTNRTYKWSLPLVDFQYNKNEKYDKKYVALFRYNVSGDKSFNKLFTNTIYMNVYTDSDDLANYTKRQSVDYSGVLVNIDETFTSENFNFDFFTPDGK